MSPEGAGYAPSVTEAFIAMLAEHARLEWYRFLGGPQEDGTVLAPLVVWRFQSPEPSLEGAIRDATSGFDSQVGWHCERHGRNWVLAPQRVLDAQRDRDLATDTAALSLLANDDPQFSGEAYREMRALTKHVSAALADQAS